MSKETEPFSAENKPSKLTRVALGTAAVAAGVGLVVAARVHLSNELRRINLDMRPNGG